MKRWLIAAAALMASGAVSASLLVASDPSRNSVEAIAAARDVPAGAVLSADSLVLVRVHIEGQGFFFGKQDEAALSGLRATHDLVAGQLIQRSDVAGPDVSTNYRLVFVPVKDVPPAVPGSRVDLLVITGSPDHPSVQPFALGVEVRSSAAAGLILSVPAEKAAAFVYAGSTMELAAVIAEPGEAQGTEVPVSTDQQAIDVAGGA